MKDKIKFLYSYLKTEKLLLFFGIIICISNILLSTYLPTIISSAINTDIEKIEDINNFVLYYGGQYLAVVVLIFTSSIVFQLIFAKMSTRLSYKIQYDLVKNMQNFEMKYFDSAYAGDLVSRFTSDTVTIRRLYQTTFSSVFKILVSLIAILIILFTMNVYLFLIVVIYLPIMYLSTRYYGKKAEKYMMNIRTHDGILSSIYNETIKSLPIVQVYSNEKNMISTFEEESKIVKENYIKKSILDSVFTFNIAKFVRGLSGVLVVLIFSYLKYYKYAVNVGMLYLILEYNGRILNLFTEFLFQVGLYKSSFVACDRILKVINTEKEKNGSNVVDLKGNVEFKNVYFEYKENIPVLKDISFTLESGKSVAFVGATGSGKSTIMNLILGFYENQRGSITFDGNDLKDLDKINFRSQIAVVLQEPYIFNGSIYDNITLGEEKYKDSDVIDSIIKVGGKYLIEKLENGIHTDLLNNGSELSLGEKQIICFARAIIRNPKILILDEATANIDTETEKIISFGIEVLMKDRSTIIIAHRLSTIKNCDNIIMIENGNIIEQGSHLELIEKKGKYENWYRIQSSKEV